MGLFKPVWVSENKEKALAAVQKLPEKEKMYAALFACHDEVRKEAMNLMSDEQLLILANGLEFCCKKLGLRPAACRKINCIVFSKEETISRIKSPELLNETALHHESKQFREYAAHRLLKYPEYRETVVISGTDADVFALVKMYDDQKFLMTIALKHNQEIAIAAISKIDDRNLLYELSYEKGVSLAVKLFASGKLKNWSVFTVENARKLTGKLSMLQLVDKLEKIGVSCPEEIRKQAVNEDIIRELSPCLERHDYNKACLIRRQIKEINEEIDNLIVDCVINEINRKYDEEMTFATRQLMETVSSKSALYRLANLAKIDYFYGGWKSSKSFAEKTKAIEEEKESILKSAVSKLDEDLCYKLAKEKNESGITSTYALECIDNQSYLFDLIQTEHCYSYCKKINNPDYLYKIADSIRDKGDIYLFSTYMEIAEKLAETDGGHTYLHKMLRECVVSDNRFPFSIIKNEDILYETIKKYPNYRYRNELCECFLKNSKNEGHIVDVFLLDRYCNENAINNLNNAVNLKKTALKAKHPYTRSLAAKRLMDLGFDNGMVTVKHNVCKNCGGEIKSCQLYEGTIEAHWYYECTGCGENRHQTILDDNSRDIYGTYYIYNGIT